LIPLAPLLRDELQPDGTLLASGILADREAEVTDAFAAEGLVVGSRTSEGDWVALEIRRP
jgi:ribosomal protein L11 methylase PrmA